MSELIHTCYRIQDVDRSVSFYEKLGFEEIGRLPIRDEAINVFMGLPNDGARLERTWNKDNEGPYEIGTGYGHITVAVDDVARIDDTEAAATRLLTSRHAKADFQIRNMASLIGAGSSSR